MAFILIVGGDGVISQRASDALIEAGHACGWVDDIGQARALMLRREPDLVLLDRDAPGHSIEAFLAEPQPEQHPFPVIMLSAEQGAGDGIGKIVHGVQDCIRKPFDPRFLVWRVNHALEVHAARQPARGGKAFPRSGERLHSIA